MASGRQRLESRRKLVERRLRTRPSQPAPVPFLPTFSCDQCEAVHGKLQALRSHRMRAHQRRREARRYVLDSVCPVCKAEFQPRPRVIQHLEVGARRCAPAWKHGGLEPYPEDAIAAADQLDCEHKRLCKREGRSHLPGSPKYEEQRRWRVTSQCGDAGLWVTDFVSTGCSCMDVSSTFFSDGRLLACGPETCEF